MLQSARAFVSSSWQPQLVLYCSGLCHGAMPHCVSHDLFACCEAAPLCPGTAKLSARTQLERDGVHPPDFSYARRRVSSVPRWSLQLSRQRGEPGALHPHLGRQPSYPVRQRLRLRPRRALWPPQRSVGLVLRRGGLCERQRAPRRRLWWSKCVCSLSIWLFIP